MNVKSIIELLFLKFDLIIAPGSLLRIRSNVIALIAGRLVMIVT
jgi:hypothetical protein